MLGLRCCALTFSSCSDFCQSTSSGEQGLSSCGMWDLPRPGIKPMSPALGGRFFTTGPPGTSWWCLKRSDPFPFFCPWGCLQPEAGNPPGYGRPVVSRNQVKKSFESFSEEQAGPFLESASILNFPGPNPMTGPLLIKAWSREMDGVTLRPAL